MSKTFPTRRLVVVEQVEEQRRQPSRVQGTGDRDVARAVSAAPGAVGEDDQPDRVRRHGQCAGQTGRASSDAYVAPHGFG